MTIPDFQALNLGYLTGADLGRWCSAQLLIKQYDVDNTCLTNAVITAIEELKSATRTKYNLGPELLKSTGRDVLVVKILSILAVRNALGSFQNLSDMLISQFEWADKKIKDLRNGQDNLAQPPPASVTIPDPFNGQNVTYTPRSDADMIGSSFSTLG